MNISQSENFASDVFEGESEVRRLFEQTTPTGSDVDLNRLTSFHSGRTLPSRRKLYTQQRTLTMFGLLASAVVVFAIIWLRPTDTFGQVQEVVAATKSVRYIGRPLGEAANQDLQFAKSIMTESKARLKQIQEKLKSATDANVRKKLETELVQAQKYIERVKGYLAKRGDDPPVDRFFVLGRYRQRQERSGIYGNIVDITNKKTGKSIRISHEDKTVTVFTKQTVISRKGEKTETEIKQTPDLTVDFYSQIRDVPKSATKLSETKSIKGRDHVGFQVSEKDGPYTWTRTFWVDKETKLPRQIEISARSNDKFYRPTDAVIEEIEFDVPLEQSVALNA